MPRTRDAVLVWLAVIGGLLLLNHWLPKSAAMPTVAAKSDSPDIGQIMHPVSLMPCGSTEEAANEIWDWLARGDRAEAAHRILETGSTLISEGEPVKLLDLGSFPYGTVKVRLMRSGAVCWVRKIALQ
jgi:hypothetical protein